MGLSTPQEAAPAYEDVIHIHPVNQSGSASGYVSLPQDDRDIEDEAPAHVHASSSFAPASAQPESPAQTIAGAFRPKSHVHCETCDAQLERREARAAEKHCCAMVVWLFIALFICGMILGIVIVKVMSKAQRHGRI